jgi:hypothetical protein
VRRRDTRLTLAHESGAVDESIVGCVSPVIQHVGHVESVCQPLDLEHPFEELQNDVNIDGKSRQKRSTGLQLSVGFW